MTRIYFTIAVVSLIGWAAPRVERAARIGQEAARSAVDTLSRDWFAGRDLGQATADATICAVTTVAAHLGGD